MTNLTELGVQEFLLRTLALHWLTASVVVALVALMIAVQHRLNATTRHNVWLLTLVCLVLMPLLVFAPRPDLGLPAITLTSTQSPVNVEAETASERSAERAIEQAFSNETSGAPSEGAVDADGFVASGEEPSTSYSPGSPSASSVSLSVLIKGIALFWLVGVLVLVRRLWVEYRAARELELQSDSVTPYFERRFDRLCARLGIDERPLLRFHPGINAPMTVGLLRVWVAIPMTWRETIDDSVFDQTLTHELGHIARKDPATHTLQRILSIVLWMYPAVWYVSRQLEIERESACDDWVLTHDGKSNSYATNLLDVAESLYLQPKVMAVGCLRSHSQLSRRIQNLLNKSSDHKVHTSWKLLALTTMGLLGTLSVSAVVWPDARQLAPPAASIAPRAPVAPMAGADPVPAPQPVAVPEPQPIAAPSPAVAAAKHEHKTRARADGKWTAFDGKSTTVVSSDQGSLSIERNNGRTSVSVEPPVTSKTPLLLAAWTGDMEAMWKLASDNPDALNALSDRPQLPRTAFEAAILQGHKHLVEKMIYLGADLTPGSPENRRDGPENPITVAAMVGNYSIAKLLLKKGALPETATLNVAVNNGDQRLIDLLLKKNSCNCMDLNSALLVAIRNYDAQSVDTLLEFSDEVSDEALLLAVQGNNTNLVTRLLEDYDDEPDESLLRLAIEHRNTGIVKRLLSSGAEVDEGTMLAAVRNRNANIVKTLLKYDPDMDEGALVLALQQRNHRVAKMLIDAGAPAADGALVMALQQDDAQMVNMLLSHDVDIGQGALIMAIQKQSLEMVRLLLDRGAQVDDGALLMAAQSGNAKIMQLIRERSGRSEEELQSSVLRSFDTTMAEYNYLASTTAAQGDDIARAHASEEAVRTNNKGDTSFKSAPVVSEFRMDAWPVKSTWISLGFNDTSPKYGSHTERHEALDFPMPAGSAVHAVATGKVIDAGHSKGYGYYVVIDHGNGIIAKYANNETNLVNAGDHVNARQKIARVGSSAKDSTGPHLHFELKQHGRVIDPELYYTSQR